MPTPGVPDEIGSWGRFQAGWSRKMRPPSQQLLPTLPSSAKTAAGASGELSSPLKGADSGGRLRMQVLAANYRLPRSPGGSESPPPHPQGTGRGRGALGAGRDRVRSGNGRGSRSQGAESHPGWVPRALQGAQNAPAGKRTQAGPVLGPKPAGKGENFTSLFLLLPLVYKYGNKILKQYKL